MITLTSSRRRLGKIDQPVAYLTPRNLTPKYTLLPWSGPSPSRSGFAAGQFNNVILESREDAKNHEQVYPGHSIAFDRSPACSEFSPCRRRASPRPILLGDGTARPYDLLRRS